MLEILATVVEEPILEDIHSSVAIGLEVDKSTDVSVTEQLSGRNSVGFFMTESELYFFIFTMYLLYIFKIYDKEGQLFSQFLELVDVNDGKADTSVATIKEVLQKKKIPT